MENNRSYNHQRPKDLGEPSSRRMRATSSSDCSDFDHDRPFKKARYVWQLKGKYHLKADCAKKHVIRNRHCLRNKRSCNSSDTDSDNETPSNINKPLHETSVINRLLLQSSLLTLDFDQALSDDIPVSMINTSSSCQDDFLKQWQDRQVTKSHLDNTINSLIELWKIAPHDAADLVENCENEEQVEDESILMAIQSHGLQTGFYSSEASASTSHTLNSSQSHSYDRLNTCSSNQSDSGDSADSDDHFLSQAVSVAIQKKGLSNYNYG